MTVQEFFHAGGYGFYLWSAFGITALVMISEIVVVRSQRKTVLKRLKRLARMEQQ